MIVVFGSLNMDLMLPVDRLPVAGETVLCPGYTPAPGGKGANQAVAAARMGAAVRMAGKVGADGFGDTVLDSLRADGVDVAAIARANTPTGCAAVMVETGGGNQIVVASGANREADAAQVDDALLSPGTLVVLQNEVPVAANAALIARAAERGARVLLNLAPAGDFPADALDRVDWLVVNEVEAAMLAGEHDSPETLAGALADRHGLACIVTLGADGALAVAGGDAWRVGTLDIAPVDTTAAGDAFVGALAAALDGGADLGAALAPAAVAGALACLAEGAIPSLPDAAAVESRLSGLEKPQKTARLP